MLGFDVIGRLNSWIVDKPGYVVIVFILATFVMMAGFAGTSTTTGTEQFTEEVPEFQALENVLEKFEPTFEEGNSSTQLIQTSPNVLSKPSLLRMLRAQYRLQERSDLSVTGTAGAARIVARALNPNATTLEEQINTVERSTPPEIDRVVQNLAARGGIGSLLSTDFNAQGATASATVATVTHSVEGGAVAGGGGGTTPLSDIQVRAQHIVSSVGGDIRVFGSGILNSEFQNVITDSLLIVMPVVVILLVLFLVFAYRDPIDLGLGVVSLLMAIIWTFGFMGLVGIPFTQMLIAVPPLLLAVGIDFGIHSVNRYREERVAGESLDDAMTTSTTQLLVAFSIVTGTTVIGFSSNLASSLGPIRDFGIVASIGIVFTTLIFGIFLPAAKVYSDRWRENRSIPEFSNKPLGSEDSILGRFLTAIEQITTRAPALFLAVVLLISVFMGYYALGVSTSFSNEDFLPPEEQPEYIQSLPEPFKPSDYQVTELINFLEDKFTTGENSQVTIYLEAPLQRNYALDAIQTAGRNPPDTFIVEDGVAESNSIINVIRSHARNSPSFATLVARNDMDGDGVPETNLERVYDVLLQSEQREAALNYITERRQSTRIIYQVESDATDSEITSDARDVAERYRYRAIATGEIVVFQAVSNLIFASAVTSLSLALLFVAAFLILVYYLLEGRWSLGVVNLVPVVITLTLLGATMNFLNISFNALTATILAITIGLGIDYSVHATHRFIDEYKKDGDVHESLLTMLRGTGGALTGSMLTTGAGTGALVLAITPILGQFGTLMLFSVGYSLITSLIILPPTIVLWDRYIA